VQLLLIVRLQQNTNERIAKEIELREKLLREKLELLKKSTKN
jgi:hypothetical protein